MLIETKRMTLRAVEMDDAKFLASLVNDPDVRRNLGSYTLIHPVSMEMERNWINQASKKEDEANMIVELKKGHQPIGILTVKKIDKRNASAHIGILIEKNSWDKGFGTEAIKGALKMLFGRMNMRRIWLRVDEENARAIRCYEKCGFTLEGVLRQDHIKDGVWKNSLIMSILSGEFKEGKK